MRKARRNPQLSASRPTRSSSHFGFGLLYRPHVTRPAGSSLLSRPALRPFPALGAALPAPRPPPFVPARRPPPRLPPRLFPLPPPGSRSLATLPLPPRLFRRLASPPPGRSSLSPRWRPCQFGASPRSGPGPRDPGSLPPRHKMHVFLLGMRCS